MYVQEKIYNSFVQMFIFIMSLDELTAFNLYSVVSWLPLVGIIFFRSQVSNRKLLRKSISTRLKQAVLQISCVFTAWLFTQIHHNIIIWNRHGHECSCIWKLSGNFTLIQCIKKCQDFLGRDILGTIFF